LLWRKCPYGLTQNFKSRSRGVWKFALEVLLLK
jgi:hypothetical protein